MEKDAEEAEKQRRANLKPEDFKDDPRGLSEWYKEKGNAHYKAKEFEQAIELYSKVGNCPSTPLIEIPVGVTCG